MFNFTHIPDNHKAVQEWFERVRQEVHTECGAWKRYKENSASLDKLVEDFFSTELTNAELDAVWTIIWDHQTQAVDVAYVLGLRDGLLLPKTLEKMTISDLLENNLWK